MIILGIDPGTATTGYGIIRKGKTLQCIDYGCIQTDPSMTPANRLKKINNDLTKIIQEYSPEIMAVENIYFFKNLKTAMPVSQAKGVILLTAAKKNLLIREYSPSQIKMAVAGYGKAEKRQIQKMIKVILGLEREPKPDDAADALAVAVCCANHENLDSRLKRA